MKIEHTQDTSLFAVPDWTGELLAWYDRHKRPLPWRESKNPYAIWVSEVMSQQTRIEAMRPYFERWMELFPTPEALAEADEDDVVRAWQGLGYYSRARNLQAGVKEVVSTYGGQVPKNRKDMESLKGVGAYTAGAVLSIAYNLREPAVDGNVLRVYARLYGVREDILSTVGRKAITALVEETMPYDRPGDFNEALMDFGATLCIPKVPRCDSCPIAGHCLALKEGLEKELPIRIKKTKVVSVPVTVGLLDLEGYYLLHRRPNEGLLRSMWEFIALEGDGSSQPVENFDAVLADLGLARQLRPVKVKELTHVFSHRKWHMEAYRGSLQPIGNPSFMKELHTCSRIDLREDWILIEKETFHTLPWAGPHGKLIELCR